MFFKSLINTLNYTYEAINNNGFGKVNPSLVTYFKNEYGANWKVALEDHLYKERVKNDKKVA